MQACVCVCVCVCACVRACVRVSVIVKRPVLPPCTVDGWLEIDFIFIIISAWLPYSFAHLGFPSGFAVGVVPLNDLAILSASRQQAAVFCCAKGENPTLMSPHHSLGDSVGACRIYREYHPIWKLLIQQNSFLWQKSNCLYDIYAKYLIRKLHIQHIRQISDKKTAYAAYIV